MTGEVNMRRGVNKKIKVNRRKAIKRTTKRNFTSTCKIIEVAPKIIKLIKINDSLKV